MKESLCTVIYECHVHRFLMPTFKLTLFHLIMSYAQEPAEAAGKEKVNSAEKESPICFVLIVLDTCIWPSSSSPPPPSPTFFSFFLFFFLRWLCAPPSDPAFLKTDGAPKKQCKVIDTCRNWVTFGPVSVCKLRCR